METSPAKTGFKRDADEGPAGPPCKIPKKDNPLEEISDEFRLAILKDLIQQNDDNGL